MQQIVQENEIYKHFKGNLYQIITLARHSETGEDMIVYKALYAPFETYVRPLAMFFDKVDKEKYPDACQEYRFEKQGELPPGNVSSSVQPEQIVKKENNKKVNNKEENNKNVQDDLENNEEVQLDPLLLQFLEADTYEERLNILVALHSRMTEDILRTVAISLDVELRDGELEEQYQELKNCLLTFEKYQRNRLY